MFQYVEVRGTHEEAGVQLGKMLQSHIISQLKACDWYYFREYRKSLRDFHAYARHFLPHAQKYFPQYVKELKGMAIGAGVSLDDLLVLMCEEEIFSTFKKMEKCTTIGARYRDRYLLLHNEDYDPFYDFYVVNARINGEPPFLSVAYMGTLAGSSAALNNKLAFSGNAIQLKQCGNGVPKNFILRAMCTMTTAGEVTSLWDNTPRAIGTNTLFITKKGVYDIEITPDKIALFQEKQLFYHTNHLLHPSLEGVAELPSKSTDVRYARLNKLFTKPFTLSSLSAALVDHNGICRHKEIRTLCTSIIDLKQKSLVVYEGNPCRKKYKRYFL